MQTAMPNLNAYMTDANARHKAMDALKAKIAMMKAAPSNDERDALLASYEAKLEILKGYES